MFFLARRFTFVGIAFYVGGLQIIQFQLVLILNVFMIIAQGKLLPFFHDKWLNNIYMFNELSIGFVVAHMLAYSDAVLDKELQTSYGWSEVCWIGFTILVNLMLILFHVGRALYLSMLRLYRYFEFYCCGVRPKCFYCLRGHLMVKIIGTPEEYKVVPECDVCHR